MYVKQYTKVALMIPLIFGAKTPQIVRKLRIYPRVILTIDLTVFTLIISLFLVQVFDLSKNSWIVHIIFDLYTFSLSIIYVIAIHKISKFMDTTSMTGIYQNKRQINFHQCSFITATLLGFLADIPLLMEDKNSGT